MPAIVLTAAEVRDNILRDRQNLQPDADTSEDSDNHVRASGTGSAVEGLYQHQQWVAKQIFPDSADDENLLRHARLRGLDLKRAVAASGTVLIDGVANTQFASGLSAKYRDGTEYVTTESGETDASGNATVAAVAVVAGAAGTREDGDVLTLTVPPSGINASVKVVSLTGGTDVETYASLLDRLLVKIRRPAAGGNKYDYWEWAMNVPGVSAAYVYPLRRGLGTVDVVVASNGGLPSDDVVAAVQNYIDDQRPVTAKNHLALKPTIKTYNVVASVKLNGVTLEAAQAAVETALASYDGAIAPGDTAIRTRIGAMISDTTGIDDYDLTEPAANVVPTVDATKVEWCRLGPVTLTLMP